MRIAHHVMVMTIVMTTVCRGCVLHELVCVDVEIDVVDFQLSYHHRCTTYIPTHTAHTQQQQQYVTTYVHMQYMCMMMNVPCT